MTEAMNIPIDSNQGYPIFMPNQVLNSEDLNDLVKYLNGQSLITRSQLIGQGIVRGLLVTGDLNAATVTVTTGVGITTSGQLIIIKQAITLAYYAPVTTWQNRQELELFEVDKDGQPRFELRHYSNNTSAPTASGETVSQPLRTLFATHVLRVEQATETTIRPDNVLSYDEMGQDRRFYLKFFLVPQDQVKVDRGQAMDVPGLLTQMPASPHLLRFGYQEGTGRPGVRLSEIGTIQALQANYRTLCDKAIALLNETVSALIEWLKTTPLLANHLTAVGVLDLQGQLTPPTTQPAALQYFYDYLNQIAAAYQEVADAVVEFIDAQEPSVIVPKVEPAELFLGKVLHTGPAVTSERYRNHFVPPLIENAANRRHLTRIQFLLERLLKLCQVDAFNLQQNPGINNPNSEVHTKPVAENADDASNGSPIATGENLTIKVTPSCDRAQPFSRQAIPYYLNYQLLYPHWSYDAHRRGKSQEHPAYYGPNDHHLIHSLTAYNSYRIEGYLGGSCCSVLEQLHRFQQNYNLAFDVICLKLADQGIASPDEAVAQTIETVNQGAGSPEKGAATVSQNIESVPEQLPAVMAAVIPEIAAEADNLNSQPHLFPHFARIYPGMEHIGGVPRGGTFVLIYVEQDKTQDSVVADFSLPSCFGRSPLPAPPSFNLSLTGPDADPVMPEKIFWTVNKTEYEIQLNPSYGIAGGLGIQKRAGKFYFQPHRLYDHIQAQAEVILAGRWGNHIKTLKLNVRSLANGQFLFGETPSRLSSQRDEVVVKLARSANPVPLIPAQPDGNFSCHRYDASDLPPEGLLQDDQDPPKFYPQQAKPGEKYVVQYVRCNPEFIQISTSSVVVHILPDTDVDEPGGGTVSSVETEDEQVFTPAMGSESPDNGVVSTEGAEIGRQAENNNPDSNDSPGDNEPTPNADGVENLLPTLDSPRPAGQPPLPPDSQVMNSTSKAADDTLEPGNPTAAISSSQLSVQKPSSVAFTQAAVPSVSILLSNLSQAENSASPPIHITILPTSGSWEDGVISPSQPGETDSWLISPIQNTASPVPHLSPPVLPPMQQPEPAEDSISLIRSFLRRWYRILTSNRQHHS
jgi:hypothetical protein